MCVREREHLVRPVVTDPGDYWGDGVELPFPVICVHTLLHRREREENGREERERLLGTRIT